MAQPIRNILLIILALCASQASLASAPQNQHDCSSFIVQPVKPRKTSSSPYNKRVGWRAATIASVAALSSVVGGIFYYETSPQLPQQTAVQTSESEQPTATADQAVVPVPDEAQTAKITEVESPAPEIEKVLTIEERTEKELAKASELDNRFNQLFDTRSSNGPSQLPAPIEITPSETTTLTRNKVPNLIYQEKPIPPNSVSSPQGKRAQFSVKVEANGSVSEFHMKAGTGDSALDSSLEAAVKQWRFEPPQQAILLENLEYEF